MQCQACKFDNPSGAIRCRQCGVQIATGESRAPAGADIATMTEFPATGGAKSAFEATARHTTTSQLACGTSLAGRYEILQLLGEGGMGAVYKAKDREVGHMVALKVIRPELASRSEVLTRFKQELVLARQVTHKNVIRIFDLGQADGVNFITMEFVEGRDLHSLMRDGHKFTIEEKVGIIRQICHALDAAHSVGVVHRDLKPDNILIEEKGRVVVMDFGIARSMEQTRMTSTGALVGTPAYMSPEQAKGETVDTRSDLFSLGVIFYELLTGKAPYESETMVGLLLKRIQERPIPPVERDRAIPQGLSDIVLKCLMADLSQRYQTAKEIEQDLDAWRGSPETFHTVMGTRVAPAPQPTLIQPQGPPPAPPLRGWKWIAAAAAVVLLAAATFVFRDRFFPKPATAHGPVTVLVADFANHTGDPIFDGTLEPMLNVALEGASFINAFSRGEARKLAGQLPHSTDKLDEQSARLVAVSQGLSAIVTGSVSRRGGGYKLSAEVMDAVTGNTMATADVSPTTKDEVLLAIPKLAAPVRKALGDTTSESVQLAAAGGTFTAASLEVVHQYGIAMEQQFAGKMDDALRSFSKAAELDPNFARAYSGMAAVSGNLGQLHDAEKYVKLAMEHVDRMTERERYRNRGLYYLRTGDLQKCVEEYSELVGRYPADNIGHNNLANCYSRLRNMPKAVEEARRAVDPDPKSATKHLNLSVFSSYGGDFLTGEREARAVQQLNSSYEKGYIALAFAQMGQGQWPQAVQTYQKLEKVNATGASFAASGLADWAVYDGRFADAVRILEKGAAADLAAKKPDRAANKFAALAYTQLSRGKKGPAVTAAESALANSNAVKIRFLAARIFVEAGQAAQARELATVLAAGLGAESQAYGKVIQGETALKGGDAPQALKAFTDAKGLMDTWIGRFDLARAYLGAGAFVEASSELDECLRRRGEALALFIDEVPTYGYFPPVYFLQGQIRVGLKSSGSVESFRTYLAARGKAGEDPLLAEVRRSAGQ